MKTVGVEMNKHWVKQAIGNDIDKPNFNKMFVLNGWLYGTDGRRLHRAKTKLSDDKRKNLPDIEKIFEDINAKKLSKWVILKFKFLKLIEKPEFREIYYDKYSQYVGGKIIKSDRFKIDNHDYQAKYIMQAFSGHAEMIYLQGLEHMLYLRSLNGRKEAVIMCIK